MFVDAAVENDGKDDEPMSSGSGDMIQEHGDQLQDSDSPEINTVDGEEEPQEAANITNLGPRARQPPSYLRDYYCHLAGNNPSHRSHASSNSSGKSYHISNFVHYDHLSPAHKAYLAAISSNDEPKTYSQAVKHATWRQAMAQELAALEENHTWILEPLATQKEIGRVQVGL